jgi:hypothetical protein
VHVSDFIVGSPARDEDFWFRTDFIEELWAALEKHNVLLLAPRRTGKTSVMYRLKDKPRDNWLVVHLNVEDLITPSDFVVSLIDAIHEHQPSFLREFMAAGWGFLQGVLARIEKIEAYELKLELRRSEALKTKWQEHADDLMETVFRTDKKVLFIIDELPDLLGRMMNTVPDEFKVFLPWFRKTRDKSLRKNLRWLLGGSVNLIATLDQQGLVRHVNDLKVEPLPSFTDAEVREFVERMLAGHGVTFDEKVVPRIAELLGAPIPLFLQMLTQELYRSWKRNQSRPLTADTVVEVFNRALLGEMARDKLQHYRSRLDIHYPREERAAACHLLDQLSLSERGLSHAGLFNLYRQLEAKKTAARTGPELAQAFQRLLWHLQSDFYIEGQSDGRYDFASRLLKVWWKKYYGYEEGGCAWEPR